MNVGIIIQARMGSTRLPGKVMMDLGGKTLLGRIVDCMASVALDATIVIATTNQKRDDIIADFCKKNGIECFRGDEQNVLSRYFHCAEKYGFDNIVRMTADNPFPDVGELKQLISYHILSANDYSENYSVLPKGVGVEIFSKYALEESMRKASLPKHFEHVNEYILDNPNLFKHGTALVPKEKRYPEIRLTIDNIDDYKKACFIIENAATDRITTEEAITLSDKYEKGNNNV